MELGVPSIDGGLQSFGEILRLSGEGTEELREAER
jgi:hypothetical protein